MFDHTQYDVTPIASQSSVETRQSPNTPLPHKEQRAEISRTPFHTLEESAREFWTFAPGSGTGDVGGGSQYSGILNVHATPVDPVVKTATDRGVLLARKYGEGVDREEASRLEILTARLRKLDPRISSSEVDSLAEIVGNKEVLKGELASIQDRYAHL